MVNSYFFPQIESWEYGEDQMDGMKKSKNGEGENQDREEPASNESIRPREERDNPTPWSIIRRDWWRGEKEREER